MKLSSKPIMFILLAIALRAQTAPVSASLPEPDIPRPVRPVTLQQLHRFLDEIDFIAAERTRLHDSMEAQRKSLPVWYPAAVWNDIESNVEAIDIAAVALPAYQRYTNDVDGNILIRAYAGAAGRKIAEQTRDAENSRNPDTEVREQAMREAVEANPMAASEVGKSIGVEERKGANIFSTALTDEQVAPAEDWINQSVQIAIQAKIREVVSQVARSHWDELVKDKADWTAHQAPTSAPGAK
jgi:hypothetical protein